MKLEQVRKIMNKLAEENEGNICSESFLKEVPDAVVLHDDFIADINGSVFEEQFIIIPLEEGLYYNFSFHENGYMTNKLYLADEPKKIFFKEKLEELKSWVVYLNKQIERMDKVKL